MENKNNKKEDFNNQDPIVIDIIQRVAKLEERVTMLERIIGLIKEKLDKVECVVDKIDGRVWLVLASIIVSILIQILMKVAS
jgi:hypothetical protein